MRRRARGLLIETALVAALLYPTIAFACPSCATREGPGIGVLALVGAMIGLPYLVAIAAIRVVRRLERQE